MIENKKLKQKNTKKLINILYAILTILILISIFKIVIHYIDDRNTNKQLDKINNVVKIENDDGDVIEQTEIVDQSSPYWEYIKMKMIDVDFNELKKVNKDVKGWVQVNGTNINYPFTQTNDNTFYLTHSFDKSYNSAGWIFLDYRNNISKDSKNTILYGHGRVRYVMFSSLKNILTNGWLNDSSNFIIKVSTEYENTLWQVFSVYHIPDTSDYIQTDFISESEYSNFLQMLLNRRTYDFNTTISPNDRILTLSTCYNSTDKVVLHAKLIKKEKK